MIPQKFSMNLRKSANYLAPILLIIIGSVSWSLTMVKSGLIYSFGMGFWGPNGHDGIWHIALINQLAKFSLDNPVFAGAKLTNYHFGFDFLAAMLHLITRIPVVNLYFQVLPPTMAILIGILTFQFVRKWVGSEKSAWWAVFFTYFGGSWGWLVNLLRHHNFGGESMFWANQSVYSLINPPYTLSLIFILYGLIKLLDYKKNKKLRDLVFCSLAFGLLAIIKIYAGLIILGGLAVAVLISRLVYQQKDIALLKIFSLSLLITLVTFLPFNLRASSLLVFQPFWFLQTMLISTDRFYWPKLEQAGLAYLHRGQWLKWLAAEGLALAIFVFGNLGTRILVAGEIVYRLKQKVFSEMEIIFGSGLAISFLFPLLFIQRGTPWNTIQFFYYFQVFAGIFAGLWWGRQKFRLQPIFSVLLVLLTIPTSAATLYYHFWPSRPPARISIKELEALAFLKKQPDGVVLTYPYNENWRNLFSDPKPLYAYETTGYVSALSNKPVFLEDEMNLEISGYGWNNRRNESLQFFLTGSPSFLAGNKISYIYLLKGQDLMQKKKNLNLETIFENEEVKIYRVDD